jgi:capsular exopolysaccharide synthesis family protein
MSRIHEALKKAEQERALSQPGTLPEGTVVRDAPLEVERVIAGASALATGVAPALTADSALAQIRRTNWHPDPKTMLFFSGEEHSAGMEEFRTLRSRLYQARAKQPFSKVLITSALPKEGKSFTAANLAQVIVRQHGRRVLLIDADLRNPQLHQVLGAEPGPGLSDYLQAELDEFSIIQRGPMENLFLIPAGRDSGNPAELVANGRLKFLLSRLDPIFDWIIIDSPPAALVSDAGLLAYYCDGVLLVVRSNATPVEAARKAKQEFADRNVLGVVLNGITPGSSPYSQYYYPSYGPDRVEAKN